jgi:hypothetical protein
MLLMARSPPKPIATGVTMPHVGASRMASPRVGIITKGSSAAAPSSESLPVRLIFARTPACPVPSSVSSMPGAWYCSRTKGENTNCRSTRFVMPYLALKDAILVPVRDSVSFLNSPWLTTSISTWNHPFGTEYGLSCSRDDR